MTMKHAHHIDDPNASPPPPQMGEYEDIAGGMWGPTLLLIVTCQRRISSSRRAGDPHLWRGDEVTLGIQAAAGARAGRWS
jgi:hypothetical protein